MAVSVRTGTASLAQSTCCRVALARTTVALATCSSILEPGRRSSNNSKVLPGPHPSGAWRLCMSLTLFMCSWWTPELWHSDWLPSGFTCGSGAQQRECRKHCSCCGPLRVCSSECPACCCACPAADVDACAGFPCRQNGAAVANCTDRPNAANSTLGRTCSCAAGYSYSDATGCVGEHIKNRSSSMCWLLFAVMYVPQFDWLPYH